MFLLLAALAVHPYEAVQPHMGTLVQIKLDAPDAPTAERAFTAAFARIHELDEILSDYKPGSELNTIARTAVGHPVRVGADLFTVLAAAQKLAAQSDGAFDITIGPLTHLWREARKRGRPPDAVELERAQRQCGYGKLHLDPSARSVMLDEPGMQLDAGGIAKGYAADAALEAIARLGIRHALVAVSGDLAFRGAWRIGAAGKVLELSNATVSTSGAEEQHLDFGGKRYSHIIDPATGIGLTSDMQVTVMAPRGIIADPLSTAISVVGRERGARLIALYPGAAAIFAPSFKLQDVDKHAQ